MKPIFQPWQLLLLILAGWINNRQKEVIDYLLTENQVLKEKLGKNRILFNDDQRRRLSIKGKILGRKMLDELATIVLWRILILQHFPRPTAQVWGAIILKYCDGLKSQNHTKAR
jgi:hypothetical protein